MVYGADQRLRGLPFNQYDHGNLLVQRTARRGVMHWRRFGSHTFNAETFEPGRKLIWDTKTAAKSRAKFIREHGWTARVVSEGNGTHSVYIGPPRKTLTAAQREHWLVTMPVQFDWTGAPDVSHPGGPFGRLAGR